MSQLRTSKVGVATLLVAALVCIMFGPASATTAARLAGVGATLGAAAATNVQAGHTAGAPDLSGAWSVHEHWLEYDGQPVTNTPYQDATYSFALTGPNTYTVGNGQGWWTSNVVISGPSVTIWTCGDGGIYSQTNVKACPIRSGYWLEPWKFKFSTSGPNTAAGTFQSYSGDGSTENQNSGTFVATHRRRGTSGGRTIAR
jgi:hypothetical protein